jgi:flagellar biosynthesis protein FlhB
LDYDICSPHALCSWKFCILYRNCQKIMEMKINNLFSPFVSNKSKHIRLVLINNFIIPNITFSISFHSLFYLSIIILISCLIMELMSEQHILAWNISWEMNEPKIRKMNPAKSKVRTSYNNVRLLNNRYLRQIIKFKIVVILRGEGQEMAINFR